MKFLLIKEIYYKKGAINGEKFFIFVKYKKRILKLIQIILQAIIEK